MQKISLTRGKFALVDDEDFEYLMQWKWCFDSGYAQRADYSGDRRKKIWMHRLINKTPDELQTDHINCDKLDNRKSNLRSCTHSQNQRNIGSSKKSSSKFKGVHFENARDNWKAAIRINSKQKNLGRFKSEIEAAKAYNEAALEHFGEFAWLNDV